MHFSTRQFLIRRFQRSLFVGLAGLARAALALNYISASSSYQLERSTDLRNWAPVESPRHGANQELSWGVQKDGTNRFFYRLRQEQTGAE